MRTRSDDPDGFERCILSGMDYLWFATGMLTCENLASVIRRPHDLLDRFVAWLPELDALSVRFASEGFPSGCPNLPEFFWAWGINSLAWHCKYAVPDISNADASAQMKDAGGLSQWLVLQRVVREENGRYVLIDPPLQL